MLKEIVLFISIVLVFLIFGTIVSFTNLDYYIANHYEQKKSTYKTNKSSKPTNINRRTEPITVEVVTGEGKKTILVDAGTTELEVFAIMGGKVKNILTITNFLKIITNGNNKIDLR